MVGSALEQTKVTHEEVIRNLGMQIANLVIENNILKLENEKLKNYIGQLTSAQ
jgi:regulator of replication initiation timing